MNHVGICSGLASLEEHSEIPNGCESSEIVKKNIKQPIKEVVGSGEEIMGQKSMGKERENVIRNL